MNVLMITEKDAANASLARIADAFINGGHQVVIYAAYFDDGVLRSFTSEIPRHKIDEITNDEIDWCDIIFCSTLVSIYLPDIVFTVHKPIFTHNYLMNRQINWGGDICFVPSQATIESDYDEYLNYSYIGIGEPKYDGEAIRTKSSIKRFLFIDSGHYPFSMEGKRELARTLIKICRMYPDYEMVIKPRFLPGDNVITHRNDIHIYDVIKSEAGNDLPPNLVMLMQHVDLRKLIDECSTMICMYSTAFVGAVVAGKGLIVLENIKTRDVYDIRDKAYSRCRENMIESGALIDYREVDRMLPNGAKCSQQYLDFLLKEKSGVADKIVEVCSYLWEGFYSKGSFPKTVDATYKNFKALYINDENMTWDIVVSNRCKDYILLKSLILIDFHVKAKLDISYILNSERLFEQTDGTVDSDMFKSFLAEASTLRDECIIRNRDIMLKDPIDAGVLLNAYYLKRKYKEIREFPIKEISAFDLFRAFTAIEDETENDIALAKEYLITFFEKSGDRCFNEEISDMSNNKFKAYKYLIDILRCENDIDLVNRYLGEMIEYYNAIFLLDRFMKPDNPKAKIHYDYIMDNMEWVNRRQ